MAGKRRRGISYKDAGVDIAAGDQAVELIKAHAATTFRSGVLGGLGGFAAGFDLAPVLSGYDSPVLFSATDGVGTKIEIAKALDRHETVGIDVVAMVVDDIVCHGAEPLFFLDYIACGVLVPERIERIVSGIAEGCRQARCALVGGETAEHPGVMKGGDYDLAGFGVGVGDRDRLWGPERVRAGDVLVGLASSGVHSNGFSLVRAVLRRRRIALDRVPGGWRRSVGEELLIPTRIYANAVLGVAGVHAAAHITGGGIEGNVARVLPHGLEARIRAGSWPEPEVFSFLRSEGRIAEDDMRQTFNLGLGMVLVVGEQSAGAAIDVLEGRGVEAFEVGRVEKGNRGAVIE